jgi:hypothetical protein
MILATWNCFSIPYSVTFQNNSGRNVWSDIFNILIDIFFIMDIAINFRTSYLDPTLGHEVSDPKKIAKQYLKGRFWIDLLASISFDIILSVSFTWCNFVDFY